MGGFQERGSVLSRRIIRMYRSMKSSRPASSSRAGRSSGEAAPVSRSFSSAISRRMAGSLYRRALWIFSSSSFWVWSTGRAEKMKVFSSAERHFSMAFWMYWEEVRTLP